MDTGSVPAELQGLSQTEEMLIARCCPIMRVIHLKGGQLRYGGHVVNVAQDITTFAATLPRLAADVPIIILRREGQEPGHHKDLHVRRVRVQEQKAIDEIAPKKINKKQQPTYRAHGDGRLQRRRG